MTPFGKDMPRSALPLSLDKYGFSLQGKHKIRENMLTLSQTTHFEHENGQNMLIPPKIRHDYAERACF
jgi:hypothetical protein